MIKLRTLLTVLTFILKDEARDYGNFQRVFAMFDRSQCTGSVDQSEQSVLVGRSGFVENDAFERGGA